METSRCWAEIDTAALTHNFDVARVAAGRDAALMAVIKANGYGHGIAEMARVFSARGAAFLGVAAVEEGLAVESSITGDTRIFLLGPVPPSDRETALAHGFIPTLSTLEEAADFNRLAAAMDRPASVHLSIDTGMGRTGFTEDTLAEFLAALDRFPHLVIDGIASHFPSADEDRGFTMEQIGRFERLLKQCRDAGLQARWIHLANSAGLLGFRDHLPGSPADGALLARPGLMLYGVSPLPEHQEKLQHALTLKTRVTLVRTLPRGHSVSYGRTFITTRPETRVATLGIGYGDGYPRHLSGNGAEVLIHGTRCPLLGRVTMDQIMADVTDLVEPVAPGAEAVLIGRQENETILATELAEQAGTIPWEILTGITARVPRVYLPAAAVPR